MHKLFDTKLLVFLLKLEQKPVTAKKHGIYHPPHNKWKTCPKDLKAGDIKPAL